MDKKQIKQRSSLQKFASAAKPESWVCKKAKYISSSVQMWIDQMRSVKHEDEKEQIAEGAGEYLAYRRE